MMITFQLKPGRDDDLIKWLKSFPASTSADPLNCELSRSAAIRLALREWLRNDRTNSTPMEPEPQARPVRTKSGGRGEPTPRPVSREEEAEELESRLDNLF